MAYETWQPVLTGVLLMVSGGVHVLAPYQAARKAAMEEGNEDSVADEWEIDATQVFGGITALIGLVILTSPLWR